MAYKKIYLSILLISLLVISGCTSDIPNDSRFDHCKGESSEKGCVIQTRREIAQWELDSSICEEDENCLSFYYLSLAKQTKDYLACKNISEKTPTQYEEFWYNMNKQDCFAEFAKLKDDATLCNEMDLQYNVVRCQLKYYLNKPDHNDCFKIDAKAQVDSCLDSKGVEALDPSICDKISSNRIKDLCHSGIAYESKDCSKCEPIADKEISKACFGYVCK